MVKAGRDDVNATQYMLVFSLGERRLAVPLEAVERVVRAVEVTALPEAPATVAGIINVQGQLVPVLDLRQRFGLPPRTVEPDDQFVLTHGAGRTVALWVDAVAGVEACGAADVVAGDAVLPGSGLIEGVLKRPDGLVLVCSPKQIVPLAERNRLEEALHAAVAKGAGREGS